MNKITFVLLCCSVFLYACDSSNESANKAVDQNINEDASDTTEKAASGYDLDSAKQTVSDAMDAAGDAANEALVEAEELKDAAVESSVAAYDSAKESAGEAVDQAVTATKDAASAVVTKTEEVVASVGSDDVKQGESIYKGKCVACHGTGAAGAPKLGDKEAWASRIAQGNAVLSQHAIAGFKGSKGYMPPKGGFMSLSDDEVSFAVQYMVSQSQ